MVRIFRQTFVADFAITELLFDYSEGMLNVSSELRFQTLCSLRFYILLTIAQRSARSRSHGYVPSGIAALVFRSPLNTLIARIGKYTFLFAVQQMVRLSNIVFIRGGGMDTVDYRRAIINADMRLHTKIPLITFLG